MKLPQIARNVMIRKVVKVKADLSVHDAALLLLKHKISSAPVVDTDGSYLGEFSEQSCMDALFHSVYEETPDNHVRSYLKPWEQTLNPEDSLVSMVEKFHLATQRILPVIEDGHVLGIVTRSQILSAVLDFVKKVPEQKTSLIYLSALKRDAPPPHLLE